MIQSMSKAYEWAWRHTTGEPWTYIMRRRPWLLPVFLIPYLFVGLFGIFLAGHVYWGGRRRSGRHE